MFWWATPAYLSNKSRRKLSAHAHDWTRANGAAHTGKRDVNDHLDVLKVVAHRLEREGIPYMLTGSLALSYYAEPRVTRDLDIVVQLSASDAVRTADLFARDFHVDADAIASAVAREGMVNVIQSATIVKVDLIVRKSTPHHLEEFARRRRATVGGVAVWIVTRKTS